MRDKLETGELGGIVETDPSKHKNPERGQCDRGTIKNEQSSSKAETIP